MPHDASANPPARAATGQTQLPLSRVRKVIAQDPDINLCSSNAAFVITLATELFLQHLATEAHNMVKLDRKPRKNLQYRDLANAVSRIDRLEFLEDIIPNTVPYGKIKADAARARKAFTGETVASMFGAASGGGGGGGTSNAPTGADSKSSITTTAKPTNNKKGRSSAGAPPTAIAALMTTDTASADENNTSGTGSGNHNKKRQQVLPFSILNGDDESSSASFMSARGGGGGDGDGSSNSGVDSGVAAAAALAQAAAASGSSPAAAAAAARRVSSSASGMAVDEAGPDAQLAQDMRRANDDVAMEDE